MSWSSSKAKAKFCTRGGVINTAVQAQLAGKCSALECLGVPGGQQVAYRPGVCSWSKGGKWHLICFWKIITSSLRDVVLPFCWALVRHICSVWSSSGVPNRRKTQTSWSKLGKGPQRWWSGASLLWGVTEKTGTLQLGAEKAQRGISVCVNIWTPTL